MAKQRSPIPWFGGKQQMVNHLLPLLPEHRRYVEVFGGAASLLLNKTPVPCEIYNDLDAGLANFFEVLRDRQKVMELHWLLAHTPMSRAAFEHARHHWHEYRDPVRRAYQWMIVARMSFSGCFGRSFGTSRQDSKRADAWRSSHRLIGEVHERLMRVQVEQLDFHRIFDLYDGPEALFYCDPPYVTSTRTEDVYAHEMTDADHEALVQRLLAMEGRAIVSAYDHPIYRPLKDAGWRRRTVERTAWSKATTRAAGYDRPKRTEQIWIDPMTAREVLPAKQSKRPKGQQPKAKRR